MNIPCLMICYERLEYTKKALEALLRSDCGSIYVIDNGSKNGTWQYLKTMIPYCDKIIFNPDNKGIAGAMNQFLELVPDVEFAAKVDCDTIVPEFWCGTLATILKTFNLDIVQAKHPIIKATDPGGWDGFTSKMKVIAPGVYGHHFVGGSGIVFRRSKVDKIPETEKKIMGWRQFQRYHPEMRKAFTDHVEIKLLDENGYEDYPDYYRLTERIK